jgi:peptidyl-prolyl cis-trans isomerase SurA
LNKAILEGVNKLQPGQTTGLIETPEACFLVLLEDRHAAHIRPLDEVRDEIEKTLKGQESARLRKKWIERIKAKTYVQYF